MFSTSRVSLAAMCLSVCVLSVCVAGAAPFADHYFAHGNATIDLTSAGAGFADVRFNARVQPNGEIKGTFSQARSAGGLAIDFDAEVTCLSVDPVNGRAWIAGVVTRNNSTHPAFLTNIHEVGDDVWFRVVDYGEGASAEQPDRSTVLGFEGAAGIFTSEDYCAIMPWPDADARTFSISSGNVQVKAP